MLSQISPFGACAYSPVVPVCPIFDMHVRTHIGASDSALYLIPRPCYLNFVRYPPQAGKSALQAWGVRSEVAAWAGGVGGAAAWAGGAAWARGAGRAAAWAGGGGDVVVQDDDKETFEAHMQALFADVL